MDDVVKKDGIMFYDFKRYFKRSEIDIKMDNSPPTFHSKS